MILIALWPGNRGTTRYSNRIDLQRANQLDTPGVSVDADDFVFVPGVVPVVDGNPLLPSMTVPGPEQDLSPPLFA